MRAWVSRRVAERPVFPETNLFVATVRIVAIGMVFAVFARRNTELVTIGTRTSMHVVRASWVGA